MVWTVLFFRSRCVGVHRYVGLLYNECQHHNSTILDMNAKNILGNATLDAREHRYINHVVGYP